MDWSGDWTDHFCNANDMDNLSFEKDGRLEEGIVINVNRKPQQ
jgi:hypothetical protein